MFSELALVDSEKIRVTVFQYSAKNDNSELGIFTSKHDPICDSKIPSYHFWITQNSELTGNLTGNSEISELSLCPSLSDTG